MNTFYVKCCSIFRLTTYPVYLFRDIIFMFTDCVRVLLFGRQIMTLIKTPEDNVNLMKTKDKPEGTPEIFKDVFGTSVFNCQGDVWEETRYKFPLQKLDGSWFEGKRELIQQGVHGWFYGKLDKSLDLAEEVSKMMFSICSKIYMGVDYDEKFYKALLDQNVDMHRRLIYSIKPFRPTFFSAREYFYKKIKDTVEQRKKTGPIGDDVLSNMVASGTVIDDHQIDEIAALFWGGVFSVPTTILGTVYLVCQNSKQEYAVTNPTECYKEGLRIYPGAPFTIRKPKNHFRLDNGTMLKPNTSILFCPLALHNDADYWEDPEKFIPERFEGMTGYFHRAYMPFAVPLEEGGRECAGARLAKVFGPCVVKTLFKNYDITIDNLHKPYKINFYAGAAVPIVPVTGKLSSK